MRVNTKIFLLVVFLAFTQVVQGWEYNNPFLTKAPSTQRLDWLDQYIDHYNYLSSSTFKQRFYIIDDFYKGNSAPIYLYICGEAECRGVSNTSYTAEIAKQTGGLIFALQHRYYGKSLPFGNDSMSTANLKFLSSQQGLSDLAYFIQYIKKNKLYGVTDANPWISIGGSYAGAMSSWFRAKYPHLTVGAIGSSGVVLAVQNFKQFDQQIYQSALKSGQGCVSALQSVNDYVEGIISSDKRQQFQAIFKAQKLTAKEFLFYWADVVVFQFQYSKRVQFCQQVSGKTTAQVFQIVKNIGLTVSPVDYGAYYLKNASFAIEDGRGARAWIYQSCTEFSYFQTPSDQPGHAMRSAQLDLNFYKDWCADIFGAGVWPFISRVNVEFGGLTLETDNLYMSNGDEDPWRWASLQSSRKNIISKIYHCPDCGHCVDLHAPADNDPAELKAVRAEELANVKKWLGLAKKKMFIL